MNILFVCTHNACRSILAEAISNQLNDGRLQIASAGSAPAGHIHPLTLQQLKKHGLDTANLRSQSWDEFKAFAPDLVITVCDRAAGEVCPLWLGNTLKLHWGLSDPSQLDASPQAIDSAFADVMATIIRRVVGLLSLNLNQPVEGIRAQLMHLESL